MISHWSFPRFLLGHCPWLGCSRSALLGRMFLLASVPAILHVIVSSSRQGLGDCCPFVPQLLLEPINQTILGLRPTSLLDIGSEMVAPSFPTLLPAPSWHVFCDRTPLNILVASAIVPRFDDSFQGFVLLRRESKNHVSVFVSGCEDAIDRRGGLDSAACASPQGKLTHHS